MGEIIADDRLTGGVKKKKKKNRKEKEIIINCSQSHCARTFVPLLERFVAFIILLLSSYTIPIAIYEISIRVSHRTDCAIPMPATTMMMIIII